MIRQLAAYGAGITLILVSAWCMMVKAAMSAYDPDAFYE